jgi:hypothetical protein
LIPAHRTDTGLTDLNNPKLGQGEDPALYFPLPTHIVQMLRYKNPKKKSGWIKALKKELNIII